MPKMRLKHGHTHQLPPDDKGERKTVEGGTVVHLSDDQAKSWSDKFEPLVVPAPEAAEDQAPPPKIVKTEEQQAEAMAKADLAAEVSAKADTGKGTGKK